MSRAPFVRIWSPSLVGALVFALRALPPAPAPPPEPGHAIELPALHGLPAPGDRQRFELDPTASSVRFRVVGRAGELLATCARVAGALELGARDGDGTLELTFDLAGVEPVPGAPHDVDPRELLGVFGGASVRYSAELAAVTRTELTGVSLSTWLGTIHFGGRVQRQPMQLWSCRLPGRPLRLQGHGTVAGDSYGLERRWFGPLDQRYRITLGLDLAWRRVRDR